MFYGPVVSSSNPSNPKSPAQVIGPVIGTPEKRLKQKMKKKIGNVNFLDNCELCVRYDCQGFEMTQCQTVALRKREVHSEERYDQVIGH
jgi:hypothetical protein